jgi:S-disulfanyl-L-cysteine oxidoreductase SoxD
MSTEAWSPDCEKKPMTAANLFRSVVVATALGLLPQFGLGQKASGPIPAASGVYTTSQAQRGKAIYEAKCGMCHGKALEGVGPNPPLAGEVFLRNWANRSVEDLFAKTITMMPAMQPGTLTPAETAQILAYVLSVNRFPEGKTDLPPDSIKLHSIVMDSK